MKRSLLSMTVVCAVAVGVIGSAHADTNDSSNDPCKVAGTLKEAAGSVVMDRGAGFTPAVIGASLKTGDKVAVQGPGSAVIDFGDGKTITVPSSTTEVLRAPGCGFAWMGGDPTVAILGTVAVGGGIAAAIALSDSGSSAQFFPISP